MNPLILAIMVGLTGVLDDSMNGAVRYRGAATTSEGPEYVERGRHEVREKQPARSLHIGDSAPALHVAEWSALGSPAGVGAGETEYVFKEGTAYVVVFVPPASGKIDALMESISKLAERLAEQPVRVLAIAGEEQAMKLDAWRQRMEKMKSAIRVPLGWDRGVESRTAFLTATGEQHPAMVYVIDTHGKLAWYGPPGGTTAILNAVLAGVWNFEQVRNEIESDEDLAWIRIEVIRAQREKSVERMAKAAERLVNEFKDPPSLEFQQALRDDLMQFGADMLSTDSAFDPRKEPKLRQLLLAVAERAAKIDRNEKPRSLELLARAQSINGDKAGALRSARKGLELARAEQPADQELIERLTNDAVEFGTP